VFALDGYARVDFRVDRTGQPYILEINANPCLAADAGFCAAAAEQGLTQTDVIARLLAAACQRK
jgi:D-alanine-D-alanine ligase